MRRLPIVMSVLLVPIAGCGEDTPEATAGMMTAATFGETTGFEASGDSGGMDSSTQGDGDSMGDGDGTTGDGTSGDGTTGDGTTGGAQFTR